MPPGLLLKTDSSGVPAEPAAQGGSEALRVF
jgi:hypothetical protein